MTTISTLRLGSVNSTTESWSLLGNEKENKRYQMDQAMNSECLNSLKVFTPE